jgi:hypothetical protein
MWHKKYSLKKSWNLKLYFSTILTENHSSLRCQMVQVTFGNFWKRRKFFRFVYRKAYSSNLQKIIFSLVYKGILYFEINTNLIMPEPESLWSRVNCKLYRSDMYHYITKWILYRLTPWQQHPTSWCPQELEWLAQPSALHTWHTMHGLLGWGIHWISNLWPGSVASLIQLQRICQGN